MCKAADNPRTAEREVKLIEHLNEAGSGDKGTGPRAAVLWFCDSQPGTRLP